MKKFYTFSTSQGCISNFNEEALYSKYLMSNGFVQTLDENDADLFILNTCSVETITKNVTENLLNKYASKNINLIVTGCYPLMYRKDFEKWNVHFFKPGDLKGLSQYLDISFQENWIDGNLITDNYIKINENNFFDPYQKIIFKLRPVYRKYFQPVFKRHDFLTNFVETVTINPEYFVIRVGVGCLGNCTFCGIKKSKGRIKSKSMGAILAEVEKAKRENAKMICLSGEDIGCWGQDINTDVVFMFKNLLANIGDMKIVIEYFDPEWLVKYRDDMIEIFKDKRIISVTFALQSGSARVIELMGRRYDPEVVFKILKAIKTNNSDLVIKSNTIVGFPQERWSDFFQSVRSLFYYDGSAIDAFGPVKGTTAASMEGQIPTVIKQTRRIFLHSVNMYVMLKRLFLKTIIP